MSAAFIFHLHGPDFVEFLYASDGVGRAGYNVTVRSKNQAAEPEAVPSSF